MNVVVFGATGMLGQAVLRECLIDAGVRGVVTVARRASGKGDSKLREVVHQDFLDYGGIEGELAGLDACFYCLGATSAGRTEEEYRRVTYGFAVAAGRTLARLNPGMVFVFVSGAGADSTEKGRVMWARIKGATENAILAMPFRGSYAVRPAVVLPMHGIRSSTTAYRILYTALRPLVPLVRALLPNYVRTTEQFGKAMIRIAREGAPKRVLESADLRALGER